MSLSGFLNMEGEDVAAFVVAGGLGYFAGTFVSDETSAIYVSILASYHLFLAWLVFGSSNKAGVSLPIVSTLLTHTACMVVVLAPVMIAPHEAPLFGIFRYSVAALAMFERGWLFTSTGTESKKAVKTQPATEQMPEVRGTIEDEAAWLEYLSTRRPGSSKAGTSVKEEHEQWLRARLKKRKMEELQEARPVAQ